MNLKNLNLSDNIKFKPILSFGNLKNKGFKFINHAFY